MSDRTCSIDGCRRKAKTRGWCGTHYERWRRHGDTAKVFPLGPPKPDDAEAVMDDAGFDIIEPYPGSNTPWKARCRSCGQESTPCYQTVKRGGGCIHCYHRGLVAEGSPFWKGDSITYAGAHDRVRAHRGRASDHRCVDCSSAAYHWSYDGGSAKERIGKEGKPYSPDPDDYSPRCVPCHSAYDNELRRSA